MGLKKGWVLMSPATESDTPSRLAGLFSSSSSRICNQPSITQSNVIFAKNIFGEKQYLLLAGIIKCVSVCLMADLFGLAREEPREVSSLVTDGPEQLVLVTPEGQRITTVCRYNQLEKLEAAKAA